MNKIMSFAVACAAALVGFSSSAVESLVGHDTPETAFVLNVGDTVSVPQVSGQAAYVNLSKRFLSLTENTITALDPGIGAVEYYDDTGALASTAIFLIKPEMQEGGRVFIYKDDVSQAWSKPGTWVQVGVETNTEVPDNKKDVVYVLSLAASDKTLSVDGAYSIQDLFIGRPVNSKREFRIQGSTGSGCTLTINGAPIKKSDYRPGILMTASAVDGTADHNANFRVNVGGNGSGNKLFVELPHGLDVDLGGPATKFYGPTGYENVQRIRFSYAVFNIGEGLEMTLKNGPNTKYNQWGSDDQPYNVAHEIGGSGSFVGSGSLVIATPGDFIIGGNAFNAFEGRLVDAQRNFVTQKTNESNGRSGPVHGLIKRAEYMAMTLAGYQTNDFNIAKGVGAFTVGNTHGYGDPNSALENTIPERELRMEGGILRLYGMNKGWATVWTNMAQKIVIADGLSYINVGVKGMANDIKFGDVDHPGEGTLYVNEPRTYNNDPTKNSTLELDGLDKWYVGNTDKTAENGDVYPIVPWFLVRISSNVWEPWWGYVNADGQMQRGVRQSVALNGITTAGGNIYSTGNNLTIDHDVTVNSLALNDSGKTMTMGVGRKITITSGGLILYNSKSSIGTQSDDTANGTLEFTNKAYIHATTTSVTDPNQIWAKILAPKGIVLGYIGNLVLGGDQTGIDQGVTVNNGGLYLGSMDGTIACKIDVPINLVGGNTKLVVNKTKTLNDITLNLSCPGGYGPKITVPAAGERCYKVYVDGETLPRGEYGAFGSGAQFESEFIAEGSGFLTVRHDDQAVGYQIIVR